MYRHYWFGVQAAVLGAVFAVLVLTTPKAAQAGLVGGVVGGAVGGAGSIGGAVGGTVSGATGAAGSVTGTPGNATGTASGTGNAGVNGNAGGLNAGLNANTNASANVGAGVPQNLPQNDTALRDAFIAMQQQQVTGQLEHIVRDQAQLRLANGTERTLDVTGDMAATLSGSVGKSITLRTLDGTHANTLADSSERVQGTITALDKGYVSFVTTSGLTYATTVDSAAAPKGLHVGSHIVATSQDAWKTANILAATKGNVANSTTTSTNSSSNSTHNGNNSNKPANTHSPGSSTP